MSLTNALDAIAVVGAIVLVGERKSTFATVLGVIAIVAATSNVVGGFLITDRMLKMFKSSRPSKRSCFRTVPVSTSQIETTMNELATSQYVIEVIYLDRQRSVYPVAEVDEFAGHRPPRHLGGRNRHAAGHRRHSAASRHRRLQVDRRRAGAGQRHRHPARHGANDRRPAADRAQPRFRRAVRNPGRHGRVLSGNADQLEVRDVGALDGSDSRRAHVYRQSDGGGKVAGNPAAAAHHL